MSSPPDLRTSSSPPISATALPPRSADSPARQVGEGPTAPPAGSVSAPGRRRRDQSIDTLRGVAIIAMVAGHVIGSTADHGMTVPDDSLWRRLTLLSDDLKMPLFIALSGFVYALRPLTKADEFPRFVVGKVRRLLVPLVTVGTIFTITQAIIPGTNSDVPLSRWWTVYVVGTAHFWFLQAIFLILIAVALIDLFGLDKRPATAALWIAGTSLVSLVVTTGHFPFYFFSIDRALELLPFFLLGRALSRYGNGIGRTGWWILATSLVLLAARSADIFLELDVTILPTRILATLFGLSGVAALIVFRRRLAWAPLARIGYFSFAIYLLHVFGVAGSRLGLSLLGVESDIIVFVVGLICGLALPVLFEVTFGRIGWISWAFLGQRAYTSPGGSTKG
ncbi:MAG: acyltransferase [Propionibacteriaceae bacterium]|jgi:fucose 4-O-acetylase-like acetyltransferase|nr:acyltransferase [Propionibacteriaceae bacterium]